MMNCYGGVMSFRGEDGRAMIPIQKFIAPVAEQFIIHESRYLVYRFSIT